MGQITIKQANNDNGPKDTSLFVVILIFSWKEIFEWNLLQNVTKNTCNCPFTSQYFVLIFVEYLWIS
jgi:hypothetical protein